MTFIEKRQREKEKEGKKMEEEEGRRRRIREGGRERGRWGNRETDCALCCLVGWSWELFWKLEEKYPSNSCEGTGTEKNQQRLPLLFKYQNRLHTIYSGGEIA